MNAPLLDQHFAQYSAWIEAMKSLRFPTVRGGPTPSPTDCISFAKRLAALEVNLLSKREQIDVLWLEFRALLIANEQAAAVACLERMVPLVALSPKKFPFAKLPTIGHADDYRDQARIMAEVAGNAFWNVELCDRVKAATKALLKATNLKRKQQ